MTYEKFSVQWWRKEAKRTDLPISRIIHLLQLLFKGGFVGKEEKGKSVLFTVSAETQKRYVVKRIQELI